MHQWVGKISDPLVHNILSITTWVIFFCHCDAVLAKTYSNSHQMIRHGTALLFVFDRTDALSIVSMPIPISIPYKFVLIPTI